MLPGLCFCVATAVLSCWNCQIINALRHNNNIVSVVPSHSTSFPSTSSSSRFLDTTTVHPKDLLGRPYSKGTTAISLQKTGGDALSKTRPKPSILLASQPPLVQSLGVVVISVILGGGTLATIQLLTLLEEVLPFGWFEFWRDNTWPLGFGGIFLAAGIAHFTSKQAFVNIVPPYGTWGGLWKVPAPGAKKLGLSYGEYHTYWSGIAEIG